MSLPAPLVVTVCVALVGLHHALNFTVSALRLPISLDMVGTAAAAFAFGPWVGAAVGVATNVVGNMMNGDFSGQWFAIVQVAGAIVWGVGFRRWFGRSFLRFVTLNLLTALACSVIAAPVILLAAGGASSHDFASALGSAFQGLGLGLADAVFSANLLTSMTDKLLSGLVALALILGLVRAGYRVEEDVERQLKGVTTRLW